MKTCHNTLKSGSKIAFAVTAKCKIQKNASFSLLIKVDNRASHRSVILTTDYISNVAFSGLIYNVAGDKAFRFKAGFV